MGKYGCCAMNNNQTSERAVLGQYATTSYITIADPYGKKTQGLSRHKKKQFLTEPGHLGRSNDTMFCKSFPWLSEGDKYKGQQMYLKTQPLASRKKGFLSSDAHRTDEFTNVCRTEQHRWALGREAAMKKLHERKKPSTANPDEKKGSSWLQTKTLAEVAPEFTTPHHLYDIGKGDSVTKFSQKCGITHNVTKTSHADWATICHRRTKLETKLCKQQSWQSQHTRTHQLSNPHSTGWKV